MQMCKWLAHYILVLLLCFSTCTARTRSFGYGDHYKIYHLEDASVCTPGITTPYLDKNTIELQETAAVVHLTKHAKVADRFHYCHFQVEAHNKGVMLVLEDMYLRRDEKTGECHDSIQVRYTANGKKENSANMCGERTFNSVSTAILVNQGQNASGFFDSDGEMDIWFRQGSSSHSESSSKLRLKLVFTPYTFACDENSRSRRSCNPSNENSVCIKEQYFCDGLINCAEPNVVPHDEVGCQKTAVHGNNRVAAVSITVFSAFLIIILLCVGCVCYFRRRRSQHGSASNPPVCSDIHLGQNLNDSAVESSQMMPVTRNNRASSEESRSSKVSVEPNDEQPPSYDSLFPNGPPNEDN